MVVRSHACCVCEWTEVNYPLPGDAWVSYRYCHDLFNPLCDGMTLLSIAR